MEIQIVPSPSKDRLLAYNYRAVEDGAENRSKNSRNKKKPKKYRDGKNSQNDLWILRNNWQTCDMENITYNAAPWVVRRNLCCQKSHKVAKQWRQLASGYETTN